MQSLADLAAMLPELFLLCAICVLLLLDLFIPQSRRALTHFLSIASIFVTMILVLRPHELVGVAGTEAAFNGMFIRDGLADMLKIFILLTTAIVFVYAKPYLMPRKLFQGEYYSLVLFGLLGMMLMVSAGHMMMVYLGIELLALSSYALVALNRDSGISSEAAMKYFILGTLASGLLLFGISLIYGASGSLDLSSIHSRFPGNGSFYPPTGFESYQMMLVGIVFVVIGLAFKFGAVPFHMWVPDVYQGAPTAVTLFIGSAPKIAAIGVTFRLLAEALSGMQPLWQVLFVALAVLSIAIGNIVAIAQTNIKRMLAYSTISHVGFLLLGVVYGTTQGFAASIFYAITYALTATASFGMIIFLSRAGFEAEQIDDFRGLNKRNPWFAMIMLFIMASSAGVPIWVGFVAKFAVLKAAIDAGQLGLAIVAGAFAVIGAFYYLRVIKVMYFDEPLNDGVINLPDDPLFRFTLSVNGLALLLMGVFSGPLMTWCLNVVAQ